MPVAANRTGNTATVTITVDITDILADVTLTNPQKRLLALRRAKDEFMQAFDASEHTDATLDARVAAEQARGVTLKASRPTGNL